MAPITPPALGGSQTTGSPRSWAGLAATDPNLGAHGNKGALCPQCARTRVSAGVPATAPQGPGTGGAVL